MAVTLGDRGRHERMAIDEALAKRAADDYVDTAVTAEMSIPRLLGDELIDAARETVGAYYTHHDERLDRAIRWLVKLVGGTP